VRADRLRDYPMPPADLPLIPILRDWLYTAQKFASICGKFVSRTTLAQGIQLQRGENRHAAHHRHRQLHVRAGSSRSARPPTAS
jgi:hypothetical protein